MRSRIFLASAAAFAAPLAAVSFVTAAQAATSVTATAVTQLTQHLDAGYNKDDWAVDTITRTAKITLVGTVPVGNCGPTMAPTCYSYTGTIIDTGTAVGITGNASPGAQNVPIQGSPTAAISGVATVLFDATSNTPDATLVPAMTTGNPTSVTDWVKQFFPVGVDGSEPVLTASYWTYHDFADCQAWVEELGRPAAKSGDITGQNLCPVLSGGAATSTKTGATVTWKSTYTSTFQVTIVGPGKINGRTAKVTKPAAVYSGLSPGHNYTVTIQPLVGGTVEGNAGKITFTTR